MVLTPERSVCANKPCSTDHSNARWLHHGRHWRQERLPSIGSFSSGTLCYRQCCASRYSKPVCAIRRSSRSKGLMPFCATTLLTPHCTIFVVRPRCRCPCTGMLTDCPLESNLPPAV